MSKCEQEKLGKTVLEIITVTQILNWPQPKSRLLEKPGLSPVRMSKTQCSSGSGVVSPRGSEACEEEAKAWDGMREWPL